jgi:hypothetical protein
MTKGLLGIALALLGTAAYASIPAGTYTNLCYVAAADDLGGMTLKLTYMGGAPQVELEECVGGCSSPPVSSVGVVPGGIVFSAGELVNGREQQVRYVAKLTKNVLLVTAPGHPEIEPQHLKVSSDLNRRFDCEGQR